MYWNNLQRQISVGYKSLLLKIIFLILGLLWLGLFNLWIFANILFDFELTPQQNFLLLIFFVVSGFVLWNWLRVWKNTRYIVQDGELIIVNYRWQKINIPLNQIQQVQSVEVNKLRTPKWWFVIKYNQIRVVTSFGKITRILLKNWDEIFISPRRPLAL